MKTSLLMGGQRIPIKQPFEGADHAVVNEPCIHCGENPFKVQGTGKRIKNHDTYIAGAVCAACNKLVGDIEAKVNTLFGLEEDERVFSMGIKIYG